MPKHEIHILTHTKGRLVFLSWGLFDIVTLEWVWEIILWNYLVSSAKLKEKK